MRRFAACALPVIFVIFSVANPTAAQNKPQWKALLIKHFTAKAGLGVSTEDLDYFYQGIFKKMQKSKLAEQVLDDGTAVAPDEAPNSVVLEGVVTYLDPFHAFHKGGVHTEFKLYRVSDHRLILTKLWENDKLGVATGHSKAWRMVGDIAAKQVITAARKLQPLAMFPPAPPEELKAPAAAAAPAPVNANVLVNRSIVEMVAAKIPEEVIITKIQVSPTNFDLSIPALAELNQKGVSPAIVKAMLKAPKVAPPVPQTAAVATVTSEATITAPHHGLPFKTAEVKRFTFADGVALTGGKIDPQEYLNMVAQELQTFLQKKKVATQVLAEGATVPEADAADSIVVEGRITEFKTPHSTMNPGVLGLEVKVYRRSDHATVATITPVFKFLPPLYKNAQGFARMTGAWGAEAIQKALK